MDNGLQSNPAESLIFRHKLEFARHRLWCYDRFRGGKGAGVEPCRTRHLLSVWISSIPRVRTSAAKSEQNRERTPKERVFGAESASHTLHESNLSAPSTAQPIAHIPANTGPNAASPPEAVRRARNKERWDSPYMMVEGNELASKHSLFSGLGSILALPCDEVQPTQILWNTRRLA